MMTPEQFANIEVMSGDTAVIVDRKGKIAAYEYRGGKSGLKWYAVDSNPNDKYYFDRDQIIEEGKIIHYLREMYETNNEQCEVQSDGTQKGPDRNANGGVQEDNDSGLVKRIGRWYKRRRLSNNNRS